MNIGGGLEFIKNQQLKTGGFLLYRLDDSSVKSRKYRTTFLPSLIALALDEVSGSENIKSGIANFLLDQKSESWSWNYWDRKSNHVKKAPYPDDLDDTFLALSVLWQYDKKFFTPTMMANVATLLFACEERTGGPYATWLVERNDSAKGRDVDLVVNCNIGYFLAQQGVDLPNVNELIESAINKNQLISPYYPPMQPAAYFLSKWYRGDCTKKLQKIVLADQQGGVWKTPHKTALAVSSLLRLGYSPKKLARAVDYICSSQLSDGSWEVDAMCIDMTHKGDKRQHVTGAEALTTALCLETISLYQKLLGAQPMKKTNNSDYKVVVQTVKKTIVAVEQNDLVNSTEIILNKILHRDQDGQIILLPFFVQKSLGVKIEPSILKKLGVASLWGWMSYTTMDDFLDNEGDPRQLPGAVFSHRQLMSVLAEILPDDKKFHKDVEKIMNRIDAANAWEIMHCRGEIKKNVLRIEKLPDYDNYWQLADRSLGHTIAAIGVMRAAGYRAGFKNINDFFRHYLIARQLNDDAHDWEEDLAKCHINAAAVKILDIWQIEKGKSIADGVNLKKDMKTLRLIMWEKVIDHLCRDIDYHAMLARKALEKSGSKVEDRYLLPLILPLEKSSEMALRARDDALEFVTAL